MLKSTMDTALNSLGNVKKHRIYVYNLTKVIVDYVKLLSITEVGYLSSPRGEGTRLCYTRMSKWLLHLPQLTELWLF